MEKTSLNDPRLQSQIVNSDKNSELDNLGINRDDEVLKIMAELEDDFERRKNNQDKEDQRMSGILIGSGSLYTRYSG